MTEGKPIYYLFKGIKDGKEKTIEVYCIDLDEAKVISYNSGYHLTKFIATYSEEKKAEWEREEGEIIRLKSEKNI